LKTHVLLNVAIAASIGGLFWPYGTTSGHLFTSMGLMKEKDPFTGVQYSVKRVSFGLWLSFTGPLLLVLVPATLFYLDWITFSFRPCRRKVKPEDSNEDDAPPPGPGDPVDFRDIVITPTAAENVRKKP